MTVELMFIIAAVVVVLVIIMWPILKRPSRATEQYHLRPIGLPSVDSNQRFGYRQPPTSAPTTDDDRFIVEDAVDTVPAVVDVVELALRAGHELVEAVHTHSEGELTCVDQNRVDDTGEPLPPDADAVVCRVEPEAPDADTDATTVDDVPADADRTET